MTTPLPPTVVFYPRETTPVKGASGAGFAGQSPLTAVATLAGSSRPGGRKKKKMQHQHHSAKDILSDKKAIEVTAALVVVLVNTLMDEFEESGKTHVMMLNDFLVGWLAYRKDKRKDGDETEVQE